ncbi:MAG: type I restriction endonuclease subunit R [Spirochaetales bacterium]|nr:type I restriction endonuclease subunit R [Spirochaetales bacterium]
MYLDKPMRDHVLLQTTARLNRPYEDENGRPKPSGFIIDFVGIFENLEKALQFDSNDIEGVVEDIELLKGRFQELIAEVRKTYLPIIAGKKKDKLYEAVLEYFMEESVREDFYTFFRELSEIYDIISPDAFLRPFIDDYETTAEMYRTVKENFENRVVSGREFSRKTAKLVQEHTASGKIQSSLEVTEINEELLKKIEESKASDTEKVFNLIKSINKAVAESTRQPYLISIGEKAWEVAENFKKRQQDTIDALEELKNLINEINQARREQAEKDIPDDVFSVYWTMKTYGVEAPEEKANQMLTVLKQYPYYSDSEAHEREIRKELYKVLLGSGSYDDMAEAKELVEKILRVLKSV